jgi:hypothetical protein
MCPFSCALGVPRHHRLNHKRTIWSLNYRWLLPFYLISPCSSRTQRVGVGVACAREGREDVESYEKLRKHLPAVEPRRSVVVTYFDGLTKVGPDWFSSSQVYCTAPDLIVSQAHWMALSHLLWFLAISLHQCLEVSCMAYIASLPQTFARQPHIPILFPNTKWDILSIKWKGGFELVSTMEERGGIYWIVGGCVRLFWNDW